MGRGTKGISIGPVVDLTGQKFGRLKVLNYIPLARKNWHCICDCGNQKDVETNGLTRGNTKSCGCLNLDPSAKKKKHGLWKSTEYAAWSAMKERCLSPTCHAYNEYGARGITVCERWQGENGFQNFIADIGMKPSPELELDRYPDNNGNYEPGNVRWANHSQQMINRRKDEGKPERSRQSTLNFWSRMSAEERQIEVRRRFKKEKVL
jgi:hypothetical protein